MKKLYSLLIITGILGAALVPLTAYSAGTGPITVKVNGMVCDFCARSLEKTFLKQDAVENIAIDLSAKTLEIHLKPGAQLDDTTIQQLVKKAGYSLEHIARE